MLILLFVVARCKGDRGSEKSPQDAETSLMSGSRHYGMDSNNHEKTQPNSPEELIVDSKSHEHTTMHIEQVVWASAQRSARSPKVANTMPRSTAEQPIRRCWPPEVSKTSPCTAAHMTFACASHGNSARHIGATDVLQVSQKPRQAQQNNSKLGLRRSPTPCQALQTE